MAHRFLALGDSYTIGEGVAEGERWPVQLAGLLEAAGFAFEPPTIIARTGWTTGELLAAVESAAPAGPFDLVSLLAGVNNQYRGLDLETYAGEFATLLAMATEIAGGDASRVLVLSIPDWGVTPFARGQGAGPIARQIDGFNARARTIVGAAGAAWVDVTEISRGQGARMLAADGLHPSGGQYRLWAEAAFPFAVAALTSATSAG